MTIDKAIEILEARQRNTPSVGYEDLRDANQLGIEALKLVREARVHELISVRGRLPGETKE